ncbi:MAG TPA: benenodin family lasso peptide [Sphingomicrobium sp.]|nr:benenodin family lasso peptide [Sphingomicrobium sp.]
MNRERENEDLIELGAVTVETKGPTVGRDDNQAGLIPFAGISEE